MQDHIFIKGARENNLKNIDVTIPRDKLVVLTGLSGSGKSSLAFDTIYAEGQRRYVESLSSYARMFLGQMDKPDVDYIDGLSPAISIDQKTTSKNPRSTVGTVTEIYDYLRLLWPGWARPTAPSAARRSASRPSTRSSTRSWPCRRAPASRCWPRSSRAARASTPRCWRTPAAPAMSGSWPTETSMTCPRTSPWRRTRSTASRSWWTGSSSGPTAQRLTDSVETASHLSGGIVLVNLVREGQDLTFSQNYACDDCGISIEELTPRMFSFNNPFGACPTCTGLGMQLKADPAIILPDDSLSILDGAIVAPGWNSIRSDGISRMYFEALAKKYRFSLQTPVRQLSPEVRDVIFYGTRGEKLELHYDQPRGRAPCTSPSRASPTTWSAGIRRLSPTPASGSSRSS